MSGRSPAPGLIGWAFVLVFMLIAPDPSGADVLFRQDFDDLSGWKPVFFPKIKEHTSYSTERSDGQGWLVARSSGSASALAYEREFNVYDYPVVRWRWKISNVYEKGDARTKSGDDYPIRIYITFKYDPADAPLGMRLKYGIAKGLYGEYPPHSSLNYIWANRMHEAQVLVSPYSDRSRMIPLKWGGSEAGQWVEEEADVLADYRRAFGADPPPTAGIAIMNDSDNTGESSISYVDFIEVSGRRGLPQ